MSLRTERYCIVSLRDEHTFTSILTNEWHSMLYQLEHFVGLDETRVSLDQQINESGSRKSKYGIKLNRTIHEA